MGLHICLQDDKGRDHPEWDWSRFAVDRAFPTWSAGLPIVSFAPGPNAHGEYDDRFRPADFARWRAAIPADCDYPERFHHLFDLMEADARWWLYFSV